MHIDDTSYISNSNCIYYYPIYTFCNQILLSNKHILQSNIKIKMNQVPKYENLKVVDLQKKCKEFKISYAGRKQQLIDRLKDHDKQIAQAQAQAAAAQLN